jgi:hypothetical protein
MAETVVSIELPLQGYAIREPLISGRITVQRTSRWVRRVAGAGTVRSPVAGEATIWFDLLSLPGGYDDRTAGTVRFSDPAAGVDTTVEVDLSEDRGWEIRDLTYPHDIERRCVERHLVGVGPAPGRNAACGTHRSVDQTGSQIILNWSVDDGGTLPDTATLGDLRRVGPPGLGSDGNVMMWAMAEFRESLYVATCNWRLESYRDWEKWAFSRGPIDTSEGTEIWRFHLAPNCDPEQATWTRVVRAGLGDPYNHGVRNLKIAGEHLYAVTANHTNGFEIWRTQQGDDWQPVMTGGFGNRENTSGRGLSVFGDHLYVGTENKDTGAEIWRAAVDHAGEASAWERVLGDDVTRSWYAELTPFAGHLYAGSLMTHTGGADALSETAHPGCYVVRSSDGVEWATVVSDSFGNGENLGVLSMAEFQGCLYVGTTNGQGAEVHCSQDGVNWKLSYKAAGDPQREWHAWKLHVFANRLYLGLGRLEHVWWSGFRLVSTADGHTWIDDLEPSIVTHYGVRSMAEYRERLYLGTASFPDCAYVIEASRKP